MLIIRGNPFRGGASGRPRPDYRDYRGARDRYSPDREMPPAKRMRPGWGDDLRANHRYGRKLFESQHFISISHNVLLYSI